MSICASHRASSLRGLCKCAITISPLDLSIQSREHLLLLQSDNQVISANTTDVGNKIISLSYSGLEAMFSISASESNVLRRCDSQVSGVGPKFHWLSCWIKTFQEFFLSWPTNWLPTRVGARKYTFLCFKNFSVRYEDHTMKCLTELYIVWSCQTRRSPKLNKLSETFPITNDCLTLFWGGTS